MARTSAKTMVLSMTSPRLRLNDRALFSVVRWTNAPHRLQNVQNTAKWLRFYYTKRGGARPVGIESEAVVSLRGAYASGMVAAPLGRNLQAASGVSVATWT